MLRQIIVILGIMISPTSLFAERTITLEELNKHGSDQDCWMAIDGKVYNMTEFVKLHSQECQELKFLSLCGHDATKAWKNKETSGSPHKRRVQRTMNRTKIGILKQ